MCHVFAGQDPDRYATTTRRLRLNGQSTSIRLENSFWEILDEIAEIEEPRRPPSYRSCIPRCLNCTASRRTSPRCCAAPASSSCRGRSAEASESDCRRINPAGVRIRTTRALSVPPRLDCQYRHRRHGGSLAKTIHSMIRVLDEERSVAFYRKAFGLEVADRLDFTDFTLVYLSNPETEFELELTINKGRDRALRARRRLRPPRRVGRRPRRRTSPASRPQGSRPRKLVEFAPGGERVGALLLRRRSRRLPDRGARSAAAASSDTAARRGGAADSTIIIQGRRYR